MSGNKNIFCASNPARLGDALWTQLSGRDFSSDIIFLPSRRAVRSLEKMIAEKSSGAAMLPTLVALGEEPDDEETIDGEEIVSNLERTIVIAHEIIKKVEDIGMSAALAVARDLVRVQDYLENEGAKSPDWTALVDEKYAAHFQKKAKIMAVADAVLPSFFPNKITAAQKRNADIRGWINYIASRPAPHAPRVIICGSTGSVPATADLMEFVAGLSNGAIILPGKISVISNRESVTSNPYYSELKFLERVGVAPENIQVIDTGESNIDFFNDAFDNTPTRRFAPPAPIPGSHENYKFPWVGTGAGKPVFGRIDCSRESEEAEVIAEITQDAIANEKTVLVITPDAAGNQRLHESFARRGIVADFSGGRSGAMTRVGRFLLNEIDKAKGIKNLFNWCVDIAGVFADDESIAVMESIRECSEILSRHELQMSAAELRAVLAAALNDISVRPPMMDGAKVAVLGTIESRMQAADIVILSGLNDGMFPATGYENPWLPRGIADAIGLPPPERKVSLMAMDFINLSCNGQIYWTRSKVSGGTETTESRFLSRVGVMAGVKDDEIFLPRARARDNVPFAPVAGAWPTPPADWSDVYVTELELLFHNPYAFYARHILRLRHDPDPWEDTTAIDFGNLVHDVIEQLGTRNEEPGIDEIVRMLDDKARGVLDADSVLFHFWHNRFVEMAPVIMELLEEVHAADWRGIECAAETEIATRNVRARADLAWAKNNIGIVADIKTGAAPTASQLDKGTMPQLPLEAAMMQRGGFAERNVSDVVMKFIQLKRGAAKIIPYDGDDLQNKIAAAVGMTTEYFNIYSAGAAPYEYRETTDKKYKAYDDLARVE